MVYEPRYAKGSNIRNKERSKVNESSVDAYGITYKNLGLMDPKKIHISRPGTSLKNWRKQSVARSFDESLKNIYGCSRTASRPYTSNKDRSSFARNSCKRYSASYHNLSASQDKGLYENNEKSRRLLFSKIDNYIRKIAINNDINNL